LSPPACRAQERRAAAALARRELEFTRSVARDGLAGMSRSAAEEAAAEAETALTRAERARAAAASAEAFIAGLAEGMRALMGRLRAATSGGAAASALDDSNTCIVDARGVDALVSALEAAAAGAAARAAVVQFATARRANTARVAAAALPKAAQPKPLTAAPLPPKPCRRRRVHGSCGVDSDGFECSDSETDTDSDAGADEDVTAHAQPLDADDDADDTPVPTDDAADAHRAHATDDESGPVVCAAPLPAVDLRRLWGVAGANGARTCTPSATASAPLPPDTARSDGGALITRDALKEVASAASRLQRLPASTRDMGAHAGAGGAASAAGLVTLARRERAPAERLLSSKTPSSDALLHALQAMSRDVEAKWLPQLPGAAAAAAAASAGMPGRDTLPRRAVTWSSPAPSPPRRAHSATPTSAGRRGGAPASAAAATPPPLHSPTGRFASAAAAARSGASSAVNAAASPPASRTLRAASPERVPRAPSPALSTASSSGGAGRRTTAGSAAATAAAPQRGSTPTAPARAASAGAAAARALARSVSGPSPPPLRPLPRSPYGSGAACASAPCTARDGVTATARDGGVSTPGRRASSPLARASFGASSLRLRTKA
jgi:hypothetical protein